MQNKLQYTHILFVLTAKKRSTMIVFLILRLAKAAILVLHMPPLSLISIPVCVLCKSLISYQCGCGYASVAEGWKRVAHPTIESILVTQKQDDPVQFQKKSLCYTRLCAYTLHFTLLWIVYGVKHTTYKNVLSKHCCILCI